jgi:hypothetical protein
MTNASWRPKNIRKFRIRIPNTAPALIMCDTVFPKEFFDSEALMSAARLSSGPKLVAERRKADCSSEALTTVIKHIRREQSGIVLKGHTHENFCSEFLTTPF